MLDEELQQKDIIVHHFHILLIFKNDILKYSILTIFPCWLQWHILVTPLLSAGSYSSTTCWAWFKISGTDASRDSFMGEKSRLWSGKQDLLEKYF